jgi:hypothetical protein
MLPVARGMAHGMNCWHPPKLGAARMVPNRNRAHRRSPRYQHSPVLHGRVDGSVPSSSPGKSGACMAWSGRPPGSARWPPLVETAAVTEGERSSGAARCEVATDRRFRVRAARARVLAGRALCASLARIRLRSALARQPAVVRNHVAVRTAARCRGTCSALACPRATFTCACGSISTSGVTRCATSRSGSTRSAVSCRRRCVTSWCR